MGEIIDTSIENEMQSSYVDYAMSVIVGRALPDARDGFKPAQRRILYAMYKLNNVHDQPTKKSARIVGEVIGKYHPHGDVAVYETLVRMAQDFTMNHRLVEGQGNMGSIDGDPPAAQRYTEVRLERIAEEMLEDIEKRAVQFAPNFDNTEEEPLLLPSKVPNLLLNGASGIAVGVATNIMPHNLSEMCDAICAYIDNREISPDELLNYVKGPDFPTGGTIFYGQGLKSSYINGRGNITIRGKASFEKMKNRTAIIITEIPYMVNKSTLVEEIANNVKSKRIQGISDLRDESGKEGIRVVIELKQDADQDVVLNSLYQHTRLQTSLPIINIAVIGNSLVTLNLRQFIKVFVDHRISVIRSRTKYDLDIATDRLHIVDGLITAVNDIDKVIAIIRKSAETKEAKASLMAGYSLSEKQATAILDMKLSKLTNLETSSLRAEREDLGKSIESLSSILADEAKIYAIIREETASIKQKYGRERRTQIEHNADIESLTNEDLIVDEESTIILTSNNYMKRIPSKVYRSQDRGGKGVIAIELREGDFVRQMVSCMSKDYLLMLTSKGRAYWLKAYLVPEGSRYGIGKAAVNLVKLMEGEKIEQIINTRTFAGSFLTFITRKGKIKRVTAESFSHPRSNGILAMPILEGDELADVCVSDGKSELFIATKAGKALRFKETDIRPMGRAAHGIRGIRLSATDSVINIIPALETELVASITEKGLGKVTELNKYRLQRRGGKGVINVRTKDKTGTVVKAIKVGNDENILMINSKGLSITFPVSSVRVTGRGATGVRLMRMDQGTRIVDAKTIKAQPVN
ncbi:MAG: DNA gyrase subunit A [Candidatus Micrarchaeota archaeon]|nr:DNA gyrase subunit A [Candidatus Micrarchaeota archaeon]